MMVITFFNDKGGAGKTTSSANLAAGLMEAGASVAVVNLDPQGNVFKFDRALAGAATVDASRDEDFPDGVTATGARRTLKAALAKLHSDFVIIDCPPGAQERNRAAIALCDLVISPMPPTNFAADGVLKMQQMIRRARRDQNPDLAWWVLITMSDVSIESHPLVEAKVRAELGSVVLPTVIKRTPHFDNAALHGMSLLEYFPNCQGARAYRGLVERVRTLSDVNAYPAGGKVHHAA